MGRLEDRVKETFFLLKKSFFRRFQKRVYIPLPGMEPRIEILKLHSGDDCNLDDDDWKQLGEIYFVTYHIIIFVS